MLLWTPETCAAWQPERSWALRERELPGVTAAETTPWLFQPLLTFVLDQQTKTSDIRLAISRPYRTMGPHRCSSQSSKPRRKRSTTRFSGPRPSPERDG